MNVSERQKMILLNNMRRNPDFSRGRLRYNTGNKKILDNMWSAIGNASNASGNGPQKQPKDWQKTWRDWKSNVLKKCAKNKGYAGGTGGGSPKIIPLTNLEETLLEVIGPESAGLENLPEGGSFDRAMRRETLECENLIPEGGSFDRLNNKAPSESISQEVVEKRHYHINTKKLCTPRLATYNEKWFPTQTNSPSTSAVGFDSENQCYEIDFMDEEIEITNHVDDDDLEFNIQNSGIILQRESTKPPSSEQMNRNTQVENQGNIQKEAMNIGHRRNSNQSNAATAVELMQEKIELLRQQIAANEKFQNRIIKIENEKLEILKKEAFMKRKMFEYLQNILPDIKDVLTHVDDNVMALKEDVEKIAPSYLE